MYGNDYEYARSRLVGSIVRNDKNDPILVQAVDLDTGSVLAVNYSSQKTEKISLDKINTKPIQLGWCEGRNGDFIYLARIPKRRDWKQGLRSQTCFTNPPQPFELLPRVSLAKCVKNIYPSFREAVNKALDNELLIAWSRKWATNGKEVFWGCLGCVGFLKDFEVQLKEEYSYLKESLKESLNVKRN